jgi:hypothetical protein
MDKEFYGGSIPFSSVLKSKNSLRTKKRIKKRKSRNNKRTNKKTSKKSKKCNCKINKNSSTPEGLGFCPKCSPLNIMMRGKDKELYEIKVKKGKEHFWKLVKP